MDCEAPSTSARSNFESLYKNNGRTSCELRKRREDETIRIRKEKREETQNKRRHIVLESDDEMGDDEIELETGVYEPEVFDPNLIDDLSSYSTPNSEDRVHRALVFYRQLLKAKECAVNEILSLSLTAIFVEIISSIESPQIIYEAVHILSEIACLANGKDVIASSPRVLNQLIALLVSNDKKLQEVAASAISNIACDCSEYCIDQGLVESISMLYQRNDSSDEFRASLVWIARNLCKKQLDPVAFDRLMHLYPLLVEELCRDSNSKKVVADAAMALALLGDQTDDRISRVATEHRRMLPRMLQLMQLDQPNFCRQAAVRYVANLASGDDERTALVASCALGPLRDILADCVEARVRRDACFAVSNIAASGKDRIESLIKEGIFLPIIYILESGSFDLRKEAAWVIFNATQCGSLKHIAYLCKLNVHVPLVDLLTTVDWKVVYICLRSIRRIIDMGENDRQQRNLNANRVKLKLEEEGFKDRVEYLQNSENAEVSREASNIWSIYFEDDDDEDMNP